MKNNYFKKIAVAVFVLLFTLLNAQEIKKDSLLHYADVKEIIRGNTVNFSAKTSTLRQIAGAPKAYWENYWEFGDGEYSFNKKPEHNYKRKGDYTVRLSSTNNYDDGKPPPIRPKKIVINTINNQNDVASAENHHIIENYNGFKMFTNREPSPNQEMQLIVSYANDKEVITNGKLYLFYNDAKFKNKNFELLDIRSYHNEEEINNETFAFQKTMAKEKFIQTTGISQIVNTNFISNDTLRMDLKNSLEASKNAYYNYKVWDVNNVKPKEERNLFFTFKTTPEMLKDTSAILTIRSIYIPERGDPTHKITEQEMEIVTSHDPNKMAVYNRKLNYRLVRFKRLKYKIRFQNNGEGPASLIKLNTDVPQMLDKTTLKIIDMYPKVPICPDGKEVSYSCMDTVFYKDKVSFQFKNIYLPGSNQKGVHQKDSTKGFVKYSMKFAKDFHKVKSTSQTAIIFDKNPPIITNSSTSSFKSGISIGAKAGFNYFFDTNEELNLNEATKNNAFNTTANGFFAGVTISPYKSYKWYWQSEVMASVQNKNSVNLMNQHEENNGVILDTKTNTLAKIQSNYLDIVPISIRYNINSIIGVGLGPQGSLRGWEKSSVVTDTKITQTNDVGQDPVVTNEHNCEVSYNKDVAIQNYGFFADITFGASRIGPSAGIRYIQNINQPTKQLHTYLIWKF